MMMDTKVLCYNERTENITGTKKDIWLRMFINTRSIIAVKEDCDDNDETFSDRCAIYTHSTSFIIKKSYDEMYMIFIDS